MKFETLKREVAHWSIAFALTCLLMSTGILWADLSLPNKKLPQAQIGELTTAQTVFVSSKGEQYAVGVEFYADKKLDNCDEKFPGFMMAPAVGDEIIGESGNTYVIKKRTWKFDQVVKNENDEPIAFTSTFTMRVAHVSGQEKK